MSSRKAVLEEEVATLMKELSGIAKSQAEYDKWYQEFEGTFSFNITTSEPMKAEMAMTAAGEVVSLVEEWYLEF